MLDNFNLMPQLRVTVNSRCQKACFYCRPAGEGSLQRPTYEMSTDEIVLAVSHLARYGITDVKLTGGDPALKEDIVQLVQMIHSVQGIGSIHLVTRHHRAGMLAEALAGAGLDCLNFSLDTLRPDRFKAITGVNTHQAVIKAIENAVPVSKSVKINTVVMAGINDDELKDIIQFCENSGVTTLKLLDLILDIDPEVETDSFSYRLNSILPGKHFDDLYFPLEEFAQHLSSIAVHRDISRQPGGLGHPMMTFRLRSGLAVEIKDARRGAWYSNMCRTCPLFQCHDAIMALRLTSDGKLQRCLMRNNNLLDLLTPIKNGNLSAIEAVIDEALETYQRAAFYKYPDIKAQNLFPLSEG